MLRPAEAADLPAAAAIHARVDTSELDRAHPLIGDVIPDLATREADAAQRLRLLHAENPCQAWVALSGGRVIGTASAAVRGRHAHIQSLFVELGHQGRGIGGQLLQALERAAREAGCAVLSVQASDDPRALARYFHLGLALHAPNVIWTAADLALPAPAFDNPFEQIPLRPDDDAVMNTIGDIDKAVRGVRRRADLDRWLNEGASGSLLVDRASGNPAGYFLIGAGVTEGRIGPVAAMDASGFAQVLDSALAAAAKRHSSGMRWTVALPGENQSAAAPLLAAGFRPTFTMTFFASGPIGQFDRYAFHDPDFL
jgi:GNAT superfamily N-acetyltransferase